MRIRNLILAALFALPAYGQIFTISGGDPRLATFANLGTPTDGKWRFCSDCAATAPCTGSGSGAFAYRVGSAWNCTAAAGGGGGTGTVTSVDLAGTANQITVTGASPITTSGSWTLSFPAGGVTLPGTTTGTFSGNTSTSTALAANGTNCSAGNYALGVDASGNAEGCTAAPAAFTPPTGTGAVTVTSGALDAASTAFSGTGNIAKVTSPVFVTPTLGAATATTVNGNTFTTGTYTLTGTAAKTLTFNNSITLAGTDSTTMTFPTTSATMARTDAANTFAGVQTFSSSPTSPGGGSSSERWGSGASTGAVNFATAIGNGATASGQSAIAIGASASTSATNAIAIGTSSNAGAFNPSIVLGTTATSTAANQMVVGGNTAGSRMTEIVFGSGVASTTANAADVVIHSSGGSGADNAGENIVIAGGKSTGTAAGGNVVVQTAPSSTTSSTLGTSTVRAAYVAQGKALTSGVATSLFEITLPTLKMTGGKVSACTQVTDGTDMQMLCEEILFSAVNKGGSFTSSIHEMVSGSTPLVTETSGEKSLSAGTLTTAWTVLNGTNKITIQLSATTSLTPSGTNSFTVYYSLINNSEQAVTID